MAGKIWWSESIDEIKERRRRRNRIFLPILGTLFAVVAGGGITAYLTNPSFDDFTAWHEKRVHETYEGKTFFPTSPAERRWIYGMYVERKEYLLFSLYKSKTEVQPLEKAVHPYLATHQNYRKGVFIRPSEYLPRGWKSEVLFLGLFGTIREQGRD